MKRKTARTLMFLYIIAMIVVATLLILVMTSGVATAATTITHCKGATPWEYTSLQDFIVWLEVPCSYLPVVVR